MKHPINSINLNEFSFILNSGKEQTSTGIVSAINGKMETKRYLIDFIRSFD